MRKSRGSRTAYISRNFEMCSESLLGLLEHCLLAPCKNPPNLYTTLMCILGFCLGRHGLRVQPEVIDQHCVIMLMHLTAPRGLRVAMFQHAWQQFFEQTLWVAMLQHAWQQHFSEQSKRSRVRCPQVNARPGARAPARPGDGRHLEVGHVVLVAGGEDDEVGVPDGVVRLLGPLPVAP